MPVLEKRQVLNFPPPQIPFFLEDLFVFPLYFGECTYFIFELFWFLWIFCEQNGRPGPYTGYTTVTMSLFTGYEGHKNGHCEPCTAYGGHLGPYTG